MLKKFYILSGLLAFMALSAQKSHTVEKGDNPYNIAKKYGMTMEELIRLNPKAKDGKLTVGDVLVISNKRITKKPQDPVSTKAKAVGGSKSIGKIILQPKQTLYGISKQYHVSEAEIKSLNPNLNLNIGSEVILPLENIKKYSVADVASSNAAAPSGNTNLAENQPVAGTYVVQPKDNYYKISRQFGLTQKQLFALNPGLEEKGLQPGDTINVKSNVVKAPAYTPPASSPLPADGDFVTYTVAEGDTVFGITNKFGVTLDDLLSLNPDLAAGLKRGMTLKIKKMESSYLKKGGDALDVVLMLPFGFDGGDAKYRSLSIDFLTGAKLALERNTRSGQKLQVRVVDAGSEASFKNSLTQINRDNTDLIIGPFFKSNVKEVLDFVKPQNIPVVAPFANSPELYDYQNLVIIQTNDNVYADRIVKEVKDVYADQKIYILASDTKERANYIKAGLEKTLKNPSVTVVGSADAITAEQNMMTGKPAPIIAILADDDEDTGAAFADRVIALSKEAEGVKAFSMYYVPAFGKKDDALRRASLVYLMDRKINPDGDFEKEILADYKQKYCKVPSKYAVIGFDVVNDMLSRENKKGELFKQITKPQTQLADKFEFVRSKPNGAYVNTGYRVIRLIP